MDPIITVGIAVGVAAIAGKLGTDAVKEIQHRDAKKAHERAKDYLQWEAELAEAAKNAAERGVEQERIDAVYARLAEQSIGYAEALTALRGLVGR